MTDTNLEQDGECQYCKGKDCPKCCAHCLNVANQAVLENDDPFLGLATTMQLIDELAARVEVAHANGDKWPKSNDLNGPGSGVTTMKLVNELKYRAHSADNSSYEWPHKRTVDGGFSIKVDV